MRAFGAAVALTALVAACGNAGGSNGKDAASDTTAAGTATTVKNDDFTKHVAVKSPGVTDSTIRVG